MNATSSYVAPKNVRAAIVLTAALAAMLMSACEPYRSAPQQVQANNPTVTYSYRGDQELLQAQRNATAYCSQYRSTARTARIVDSSDGGKTVVFECEAMAPSPVQQQPFNPNLSYVYRTDQELLDASRNAEIYCMNNGARRATSTIVTNADGTRTVTFQCVPR